MRLLPGRWDDRRRERAILIAVGLASVVFCVLLRPPAETGRSGQALTALVTVVVILMIALLHLYLFSRFSERKHWVAWGGLAGVALTALTPVLLMYQNLRSTYSVQFEGTSFVIGEDRDLTELGKIYKEQFPTVTSRNLVERTGGKPQLVWEESALRRHGQRMQRSYLACAGLVAFSAFAAVGVWRTRALRLERPEPAPARPATIAPLKKRFQVALSFPGEVRDRAEGIASMLESALGRDRVFYDAWYRAELARPDMDLYLQNIYQTESDLLVVLLCEDYNRKEWCGLEWRVVRTVIKARESHRIMFLRLDQAPLTEGLLSIDGYLDISAVSDREAAAAILSRVRGDSAMGGTPGAR